MNENFEEILKQHEKTIYSLVNKFYRMNEIQFNIEQIYYEDLLQDCKIQTYIVYRKFDKDKANFNTFLTKCLKNFLLRKIDNIYWKKKLERWAIQWIWVVLENTVCQKEDNFKKYYSQIHDILNSWFFNEIELNAIEKRFFSDEPFNKTKNTRYKQICDKAFERFRTYLKKKYKLNESDINSFI